MTIRIMQQQAVDFSRVGHVAAIFAHPDDAEISCYGTLARLRQLGWTIELLVLTDGALGVLEGQSRCSEAQSAARLIEASLKIGPFLDGEVKYDRATIGWIEQALNMSRPSIVFSHFVGATANSHQDHDAVGRAVQNVVRRLTWLPTVLLSDGSECDQCFSPNFFVDITDTFPLKKLAIKCHETQLRKYYMAEHIHEIRAERWTAVLHNDGATQSRGVKWEAFQVWRSFYL